LGEILEELAKLVEFTLGKNKIPAFLSQSKKKREDGALVSIGIL
jgi:hypothetical protein